MTVFPMASAGAIMDTRPRSGASSGATMPMTPTGSCNPSVTARAGGWWTLPSNLSAMPAASNMRSIEVPTSARASLEDTPVNGSSRLANSSARTDRFSAKKYSTCARL